jgi:hypothetical protein
MARIETYTVADSPISGSDKLIGTDSAHDNATKNFTISEIADFIGGSGGSFVPYTGATDDVDLGVYALYSLGGVYTSSINISSGVYLSGDIGTSGQVLTSQGVGTAPIWTTPTSSNPTLQTVTDSGNNVTTNSMYSQASMSSIGVKSTDGNTRAYLSHFSNSGFLSLVTAAGDEGVIKVDNLTAGHDYQLPDAGGTIALASDIVFYRNKVTMSSSDIQNMDTTQIIAVPDPPAGKAISVTNIAVRTTAGTGYSTSNNILLRPVGGSSGICSTQSGPLGVGNGVFSENVQTTWYSPSPSNVALEFRGSQGVPPSGGTLGATVYITYQLIDL